MVYFTHLCETYMSTCKCSNYAITPQNGSEITPLEFCKTIFSVEFYQRIDNFQILRIGESGYW